MINQKDFVKGVFYMYNENNNNEQNNGYTNNGHPQEYYYSTGNQNYQNNSTPAVRHSH